MIRVVTDRCTVIDTNKRYLWVALFIKNRRRALFSFTVAY